MVDKLKQNNILTWFAGNHVAANLIMMLILVGGGISMVTMNKEIFTDIDLKMVQVSVSYRGASPEEVEEGVCIKVEEEIAAIEDIKKLTSSASEGVGTVTAELEDFADTQDVLDDIKAAVDRIETFPEETEKPVVSEVENLNSVISVVVYGSASQVSLKRIAEDIRDDLSEMENISQVALAGVPEYEISVEISEEALRKYNLSFDQIASIIRNSSIDVPGGSVKTEGGEILIRTKGQRYWGDEFERITVLTKSDGTKLTIGDIGYVIDGFEDEPVVTRFNGHPAVMVNVSREGKEDALDIAETVKNYVETKKQQLPDSVSLATWNDTSEFLNSRLHLLVKNAMIGLVLVFACLSLFLDFRLAFWTTMGIPISFMGAFCVMPMFDLTINMISLYAFIVCLGIVVDDAIVVGENIFEYRMQGMNAFEAACKGIMEMWAPVMAAVLTTILAFMPLLFTQGTIGKFLRVIPIVVISVLMVSLIEALFVLPAHLAASLKRDHRGIVARVQGRMVSLMDNFVNGKFARLVGLCVRWRYVTFGLGVFIFIFTIGLIKGGYIKFTFLPTVDSDVVYVSLEMPLGTPSDKTADIAKIIEKAADKTRQEIDDLKLHGKRSIVKHMATVVGQAAVLERGPEATGPGAAQSHLAAITVELLGGEDRKISSAEFASRWRKNVGEIAGVSSIKYEYALFDAGDDVKVELSHRDFDKLKQAVEKLKLTLSQYPGVSDVADDFDQGKREIKLKMTTQGRTLGLTLGDLAKQARQGFYGEEVQRIQRGRDDIRVMLRYPQQERKSLADVENMRVRLPDGTEVPFRTVADVTYGRGYSTIYRADRKRVINVTADVDETIANADEINKEIFGKILPQMKAEMPGLNFDVEGEQKSRNESMGSLGKGFIYALLGIYALLAVQFRSYVQPVIIMSAIPFGLIGAVFGHIICGRDLSLLSMFGIVALMGIVVNDSLIMIDLINRERKSGISLWKVLRDSSTRRFRPILLTTMTTFIGLVPMILEKSLQAQFLIPMAVSLAFGVVFATCITLILVPSLYMILEDAHNLVGAKSAHAE